MFVLWQLFFLMQDQSRRRKEMGPPQFLLGTSVCGWSFNGARIRQSHYHVSRDAQVQSSRNKTSIMLEEVALLWMWTRKGPLDFPLSSKGMLDCLSVEMTHFTFAGAAVVASSYQEPVYLYLKIVSSEICILVNHLPVSSDTSAIGQSGSWSRSTTRASSAGDAWMEIIRHGTCTTR